MLSALQGQQQNQHTSILFFFVCVFVRVCVYVLNLTTANLSEGE